MHPKINLLFVNFSFDTGGIETLILDLCRVLDKARFEINVCSFQNENTLRHEFERLEIPFHVLKKRPGIDFSLIFKLRRLYRDLGIDIVHSHNAEQWLYAVLGRLGSVKPVIVHTQHSVLNKGSHLLLKALRYLSRRTYRAIGVAQYICDYLINTAKISSSKVKLIYNGIDLNRFINSSDTHRIKNSLSIPDNFPVVGIVARLVVLKDHKTLLKAFKIVIQEIPDTRLLIIGEGELMVELKDYSKSLGVDKQVIFLGNRRDIPELLKTMDVFVLPSLSEGLPVTIIESMASMTPVIATSAGGVGEAVINEKTGIIIPKENPQELSKAICSVLKDKRKSVELSTNAFNRVRDKFDLDRMVNDYKELYESAVK